MEPGPLMDDVVRPMLCVAAPRVGGAVGGGRRAVASIFELLTRRPPLPSPMRRLKTGRHLATLILLFLFTDTAWAEICKGSKVPKAELAQDCAEPVKRSVTSEL